MPVPGTRAPEGRIKLALAVALCLNLMLWCGSRDIYARWSGVPPVPGQAGAVLMTLGDSELSYRALSLMLQNLGDIGADVTPLSDYNYAALGKWFFLLDSLNPVSDYAPYIAAYYFGATKVPGDMSHVVDFLSTVGERPVGEKWRWLGHAVYAAQHRMYDFDLALKLAYKLAKMPNSGSMPTWARDMPAFVLKNKGDKEAARELMENMLSTGNLSLSEVANLRWILVNDLGVDPERVDRIIRMRGESR